MVATIELMPMPDYSCICDTSFCSMNLSAIKSERNFNFPLSRYLLSAKSLATIEPPPPTLFYNN